jgi:hypothetical protein
MAKEVWKEHRQPPTQLHGEKTPQVPLPVRQLCVRISNTKTGNSESNGFSIHHEQKRPRTNIGNNSTEEETDMHKLEEEKARAHQSPGDLLEVDPGDELERGLVAHVVHVHDLRQVALVQPVAHAHPRVPRQLHLLLGDPHHVAHLADGDQRDLVVQHAQPGDRLDEQ